MSDIILHSYWRSSAAYRVRIALHLKDLSYSQITHNLLTGAQHDPAYLALAPHALVPIIEHNGDVLMESPAILEWIETRWPEPALLPSSCNDTAIVRAMCALIACDIHPLNNLRVLNALRNQFSANNTQVKAWIARWIVEGFSALELMVERYGGLFAFGDAPTLIDCYLVPQIYNARRYGIDLSAFPKLCAADTVASSLPAVISAHPDLQPDANQ